jgi:hypothetical protein
MKEQLSEFKENLGNFLMWKYTGNVSAEGRGICGNFAVSCGTETKFYQCSRIQGEYATSAMWS